MSKRPTPPPSPGSEHSPKEPGFEESLGQLEAIIERIESGQVGLEASIAEYERGVGLLKRCREILKRAEQRVEELHREVAASESRGGDRS